MLHLTTWLYNRLASARQQANERGAVAVEYGVLVAAVAVALFVGALAFFEGLADWFGDLIGELPPFD